ncbi:MAG: hypothetical protein U5N85_14070 [Arcicella sp.]|nr:hypothetical protein [Arcicella sp.]
MYPQDRQNPKTTQIQFRVSLKDKQILEAKAKATDKKKLSVYLLDLGLNASEEYVEKVGVQKAEDSEIVITLRALRQSLIHVGNNLNQLTKKRNSVGFLIHSEQRQVFLLSEKIEELCEEIKTKL